MTDQSPETVPPDPAAMELIQRRVRRLMLIAGLTLGIGVFAVFGAIIYRLTTADKPAAGAAIPVATLAVPAGAKLVSSAVEGNRIVLGFEHAGGTTVVLVDARAMAVTGKLEAGPAGSPATVPSTP